MKSWISQESFLLLFAVVEICFPNAILQPVDSLVTQWKPPTRIKSSFAVFENNHGMDDSEMMSSLSQRIQKIRDDEDKLAQRQQQELTQRMQRMQQSESIQAVLDGDNYDTRLIQLPVVCFDALLPKQELEGRAEDSCFCGFLRDEVGLGGFFVMTSLNYFTRTIRRHGTVVKLVAMDAPNVRTCDSDDGDDDDDDHGRRVPTAVDFSLVGLSRCRVVGPRQAMKMRIGRWRRAYDPNGEETKLGWGEERFTDAPEDLANMIAFEDLGESYHPTDASISHRKWTNCWVEVNLELSEHHVDNGKDSGDIAALVERLPSMVDEWVSLASDLSTYENTNVTASTRITVGSPGLWVEPQKLVQRVMRQLGPRPSPQDDPTTFCFWVAALINPLPVLGVSLEIRGRLLEAPTVKKRFEVVETGLKRSIDNLKGTKPL
jgi:hypothetical protein